MAKQKFISDWFLTAWGKVDVDREVSSGWFSKKTVTVKESNPRFADYAQFAAKLEEIYTTFDAEGYDVVNVLPLAVGSDEAVHAVLKRSGDSNYLGQVGFSVTRGVVAIGKLRAGQ